MLATNEVVANKHEALFRAEHDRDPRRFTFQMDFKPGVALTVLTFTATT